MQSSNNEKKDKKKKVSIWVIAIALPVLLFIIATLFKHVGLRRSDSNNFVTAQISKSDISVTISSTGTLEPEEVIDVGAQVAGQIISFGKDTDNQTIDYGSNVEKDMILAQIDDSLYAAGVDEAKAQILSNKANLVRAKANLERAQANLTKADQDWKRAQNLGPSEALSQSKYDQYKSAYEIAKADIEVNKAEIKQYEAAIAQSEAALDRAQRNFDYCTIRSPVKGVIIDRRVNIGQTVVASLNAPSLFLLAKDLKEMEIWVAVNEADIGKIKPGINVEFTADAFPGEDFKGQVDKIRLNASMTQNVVSYTVVVVTDNKNGRLLPYLTANVEFELDRRDNVLAVPKAALRWTPTKELVSPEYYSYIGSSSGKVLWIPDGQLVRPIKVTTGLSDGIITEVEGEGLTDGLKVVTDISTTKKEKEETDNSSETTEVSNPFAPKIPTGPGGSSGGGSGPGPR